MNNAQKKRRKLIRQRTKRQRRKKAREAQARAEWLEDRARENREALEDLREQSKVVPLSAAHNLAEFRAQLKADAELARARKRVRWEMTRIILMLLLMAVSIWVVFKLAPKKTPDKPTPERRTLPSQYAQPV